MRLRWLQNEILRSLGFGDGYATTTHPFDTRRGEQAGAATQASK